MDGIAQRNQEVASAVEAWRLSTSRVQAHVKRILYGEFLDPHELVELKHQLDSARLRCFAALAPPQPKEAPR